MGAIWKLLLVLWIGDGVVEIKPSKSVLLRNLGPKTAFKTYQ